MCKILEGGWTLLDLSPRIFKLLWLHSVIWFFVLSIFGYFLSFIYPSMQINIIIKGAATYRKSIQMTLWAQYCLLEALLTPPGFSSISNIILCTAMILIWLSSYFRMMIKILSYDDHHLIILWSTCYHVMIVMLSSDDQYEKAKFKILLQSLALFTLSVCPVHFNINFDNHLIWHCKTPAKFHDQGNLWFQCPWCEQMIFW